MEISNTSIELVTLNICLPQENLNNDLEERMSVECNPDENMIFNEELDEEIEFIMDIDDNINLNEDTLLILINNKFGQINFEVRN